jgi:hypothetical protein
LSFAAVNPYNMMQDLNAITDEGEFKLSAVVFDVISQLRRGCDLHHVTFPVFVLEPRSLLELFLDFINHPYLIL